MAETQLDISTKKAIDELKALQAEIVKTGNVAENTADDVNDAFKLGAAQGLADGIEALQKEFKDLERSANTLRQALRNTTDPRTAELYRQNIARLEQGMKKLETTAKATGVSLKEVNKEGGLGKQVFGEFFGAFTKASLIAAALVAVKNFVVEAVRLSEETEKATRSFAAFLGNADKAAQVVSDLQGFSAENLIDTGAVFEAGKALLAFGESSENLVPVLSRISDISAATGKNFNELTTIYGKARAAGVLYAEDINQLVDAGIPIIQEFAKQLGVSNDQVKKLASEGKISFEELQLAFFNLSEAGGKFADQSKINAETIGGAWTGLVTELRPIIESIGDFFSEVATKSLNTIKQFVKDVKTFGGAAFLGATTAGEETGAFFDLPTQKEQTERERLEKEAAEARKRAAAKNAKDLAKQAEALERERQRAIIDSMAEGMAKEIAIENLRFAELEKRLKRFNLDTEEAETEHRKNLLLIHAKYFELVLSEQEEAERAAREQLAVEGDTQQEILKKRFDAAQKQIELEKEIFAGVLLERQKGFNSENELDKKSAEEKKKFDEDLARAREEFQLLMQAREIENMLAFGQFQGETEKKILEQRLANIRGAIAELQTTDAPDKKPFDLLEFLGIDDKNRDEFENAVKQIVRGLNEIAQARLDAAQAAVDAANEQVEAAEDAVDAAEEKLDREIELAQTGEANNLALREAELAAAEQQAADAKRIRDEAIKEQQKAARAQLIVDSATQASSIATAAASIFAQGAKFWPVGLGLAVASIAGMIALFASIKARAKAITAQKFKRGGEVQPENRVYGQPDSDGEILVRATPGEFVTNRKQSQKHKPLLEAINAGDTAKMALYLDAIKTGGRRDVETTAGIGGGVSVSVNATDPKLRELMAKNNALQKRIFELEKNRPQSQDMGDYYLVTKNGRKERIKKRQR